MTNLPQEQPSSSPQGEWALQEELPEGHRSGFVALVGRPSVGKSTLMNHFLGEKIAIVSDKPQTTRNRLLGILTRPDAQVIFVDMPGLHKPRHLLGEYMMEQVTSAVADADLILFLVDASATPKAEDDLAARTMREASSAPALLILNKADLLSVELRPQQVEAYRALGDFREGFLISALHGMGCQELLERVVELLPEGPRYYPLDQLSDQQERFIVSELIREAVLQETRQEVPYGVAVAIEQFRERTDSKTYIEATVYVERESHKGIVIGQGGQRLRQIGQAARLEIERSLEQPVFLELWIKVRKNWRKKEEELRRLGYGLSGRRRGR